MRKCRNNKVWFLFKAGNKKVFGMKVMCISAVVFVNFFFPTSTMMDDAQESIQKEYFKHFVLVLL
jgi:hypothetical protein